MFPSVSSSKLFAQIPKLLLDSVVSVKLEHPGSTSFAFPFPSKSIQPSLSLSMLSLHCIIVTISKSNFALAFLLESIVNTHCPVPEHEPLQPVKVEPLDAEEVNVTTVPLL